MGRTLADDVPLAESWGYSRRDAIRVVARLALIRADEGVQHPVEYLRELYEMMVATADLDATATPGTEREHTASDERLILL